MHRRVIAVALAAGVAITIYIAYQQANRSPYALEIDATRDVIQNLKPTPLTSRLGQTKEL
jgi:hypothetical protein